jgi:hypothetical protein
VQGGPVDQLLDVAVKRAVVDQLEVEVRGALEDRLEAGLAGDDGEEGHLHAVDEAKKPETRERRVEKALKMLREGRKR